ncbi:O-antigen ligase family protein [Protaetiibacter mangrovi]|uniref:O-antigen ligase family protein n=1 Tax=Protaetiibacter mangrovi TaxID=2970926 RepID=A0ABT1ZFH8_9MICO|nr:O-antigen ligase family protein [Protaetiibacter mangrovi]MCS0499460.1 O-antigen ligase family protein [Protaetiibacter mangrovi]TPX04232.1 O-antigen ligase family protein [Schumannella luteola]
MSERPEPREVARAFLGLLRSPRFSAVLATTGVGIAALSYPIVRLIGWAGYLAALVGLVAFMIVVLLARRRELDGEIPPISLLVFVGWAGISIVWSSYQWVTLGGVAYLVVYAFVGVFIAYTRDTIQIVRAWGDVLRVALGASLAIELVSGILIDAPIPFLNVLGKLAELGPISGVLQTRNQLGLLALVGAVSFATELRTRSVRPLVGVLSLVGAGLCIALTQSPIIVGTAAVVAAAAAVLYGIRRVRPERRQAMQFVVLGAAVVLIVVAWIVRSPLVTVFNAQGALDYRLHLWQKIVALLPGSTVQGWGWTGRWHPDIPPFLSLTATGSRPASSALNAYLDVLFQLGIIGLVVFVGMLGLAFTRSWLLAGRRRSVIYAWPALVLVVLLLHSLAESAILSEFGWLTFVVCCVTASRELSWRSALAPVAPAELPHEPSDG